MAITNFKNQKQIWLKIKILKNSVVILLLLTTFTINANIHNNKHIEIKTEKNDIGSNKDSLQNDKQTRKIKPSRPEIIWAIVHPFTARKAIKITKLTLRICDSIHKNNLLTNPNGGQMDAYRHGLWMALLSQEIGEKRAYSLGLAHEKANYLNFKRGRPYSSYANNLMDSINNLRGIEIGKLKISKKELPKIILDSVCNDYFVIICIPNNPLDEENQESPPKRSWKQNEILVSSGWKGIILEHVQLKTLPKY